ncbi:hypothetical protein NUW58_g8091 [Xylaria curta]|uniref:Uncharacterized protein n=1 Tax=Xylaria curta TaxID=42375 RepID=A0ACC1NAV1_9PEZI|nr:hypothetical protein NUW58_g8091 [Xylaria curta]
MTASCAYADHGAPRAWARPRCALALARRRNAELRWVEEVVAERERLLQELENEEVENGEDIDTWFAEGPLEEALAANPWT